MTEIAERFRAILPADAVLTAPSELVVYECDAFTLEKKAPDLVVFPASTEDVAKIVRLCNELDLPFVPRGAGTSLAGGCLPVGGGVIIALSRLKTVHEVNLRDRYAVVGAGVVNLHLSNLLRGQGDHYAPDPSSQGASTIGGNTATNAGGPHTLKYGVTVNHVLGVEMVTPAGDIVQLGGPVPDPACADLLGAVVGSEGTLGIVTKIWVRLTRNPPGVRTLLAVFDSVDDATACISAVIAGGIVPAALEMIDNTILRAVESAFRFGFPVDAGAVLIIEVDGLEAGLNEEARQCEQFARSHGAREVRQAATEDERKLLWKCRKQAFGALGRIAPSLCTQDGVVPRTKLPHMLKRTREIAEQYQVVIGNVFHAGDGNIHPVLLFDERDPDQVRRVLAASTDILDECIACGGSVTGEHGIGIEKIDFLPKLFSEADLAQMLRLRQAFNPANRCSPRKIFPTAGACVERARPAGVSV
ncbi:MAG: FAD-binding protein [Gemmataceae bacterium]|nr:FAD-binding protein [Gemmataceae bacterium]